jgi:excinuclease ABC subunit A
VLSADTETGRYLRGETRVHRARHAGAAAKFLVVEGAAEHNLKNVTARFPVGRLSVVSGVSGSGKSSLVEDVLYRAALRALEGKEDEPIGRTPRSCPVTYLGAFAPLREIYARQPAALARGLKDGAFSFNTAGGRCERCEGAGWVTVEMYFLADLLVPCETCGGARFRRDVLEVRYHGASVRDALEMTVDQAFEHFAREPRFTRALHLLRRVGLGYLQLGQPATQLSGGEAQRLKIARELSARGAGAALVVLDEPTVGLHFRDVQGLLDVLDELTQRGDTVVLVEHNLDVIANADWVVDLGPDGGAAGGRLLVEGPPEALLGCAESATGAYLARHLAISPERTAAPAPSR